jgi:hypothetical protein
MTRDEIITLLQIIAVNDGREVDNETTVTVWMESARRARWTFEEAKEAVLDHFAHSSEWLKQGHVTERIRANRRQPAPVSELRAVSGPAPASEEQRARAMAIVRDISEGKRLPE